MKLSLYAVRNHEKQWFRSKGRHNGWRETWVEDLGDAKTYTLIGQARARITTFANQFPEYPVPELVELVVTKMIVLTGEADRVHAALSKKRLDEERRKEAEAKMILEEAERKLAHAKERVAKLRSRS